MRSSEMQFNMGRNPIHDAIEKVAKVVGSLDTLTVGQLIDGWEYITNLLQPVDESQLGQFVDADVWFFELTQEQQDQVIAYMRSQNVGKQTAMVPNWYDSHGRYGAFRYEKPFPLPVASR
jgi:hypothetical protein